MGYTIVRLMRSHFFDRFQHDTIHFAASMTLNTLHGEERVGMERTHPDLSERTNGLGNYPCIAMAGKIGTKL